MGNTVSDNNLITNTKSEKWSNVEVNPYDTRCLFVSPNRYYYYKFHVKVLKDPLNKLPKHIKIVLDNNSLQLKKNKKVYCYIPYTEIKGWRSDATLNIWSFILLESSSLVHNKNSELDKIFMFKTSQYLRISQLILSFTYHISTQLQYKRDKLDILANINKKIKKNRKKKNKKKTIKYEENCCDSCDENEVVCDENEVVCDENEVVCDENEVVCDENEVVCDENEDSCDVNEVVGDVNEDSGDVNEDSGYVNEYISYVNEYSSDVNEYSSEVNEYSSENSSEDSSEDSDVPSKEVLLFIA